MLTVAVINLLILIHSAINSLAAETFEYPENIIKLTTKNFDDLVLNSKDVWIVAFFAPWCPHCQSLVPAYTKVADQLKGVVKVGAVNCDKYKKLVKKYQIEGYPTVKIFGEDKQLPKTYKGRNVNKLIEIALKINNGELSNEEDHDEFDEDIEDDVVTEKHRFGNMEIDTNTAREGYSTITYKMFKYPEIFQIVDETTFKEICERTLCVITFLPHISNCPGQCRNDYLSLLNNIMKKFNNSWVWFWAEAGSQADLERYLNIHGHSYPSMAVLNMDRKRCSVFETEFSQDGVEEFVNNLSRGKGVTISVNGGKIPEIKAAEPWKYEVVNEKDEL